MYSTLYNIYIFKNISAYTRIAHNNTTFTYLRIYQHTHEAHNNTALTYLQIYQHTRVLHTIIQHLHITRYISILYSVYTRSTQ